MTTRRYSFDSDPHPLFSTYSAGNFAEVAPERLSIMSWSLIGDPVERGCRALVVRLWPRATWQTGSHYTFVGYFACRPYHNLSAFCHFGRDVPGVRAGDVTASYFEDSAVPELPARLARGQLGRAGAVPRMIRLVADLRPRIVRLAARTAETEGMARRALRGGGALSLGAVAESARMLLDAVWELHYTATFAVVPLRSIHRSLGERVVDYWDDIEPWLARPRELVWSELHDFQQLAMPLGPGDFLRHAFYEIADDREPWSRWSGTVGESGIASAPRRPDPDVAEVAWDVMPWAKLAMLPQLTRLLGDAMAAREATKSLAMRVLHVFRMVVPAVAEAVGLRSEDWPYLTIGELLGDERPALLERVAASRRAECAEAVEQALADTFVPGRDDPSLAGADDPGSPAPGGRAHPARGISPGVARGTVVTSAAPDGLPQGMPKVLVCERIDADVAPLLTEIGGVVTARGSLLSHVAILMREHGIPAVVGHELVRDLRAGQQIEINGNTGEVMLLDG